MKNNDSTTYWLVGDQPPAPSSHLSQTPPPGSRSNFRMIAPTARRPQEFVDIHRNSDIAWSSGPSPVVQHVPPTNHRHYSDGISSLQDINGSNPMVSSSTASDSDLSEVPLEPVNYRDDIGLDDKALVTISTKELNRLLKKKGINKSRQKEIKSERRTLKNRGYASNCRVSREEEEKTLEKEIFDLEAEIKRHGPGALEKLEEEYVQLRNEINCIKKEMNINDDSDDSDYKSDIPKLEDIKDDIKTEPEDNEDDDYTSSDEDDGPN